jgi:hypothetical protein
LGNKKYIFWPIFKIENVNVVIIEGEIFTNHLKICFSVFKDRRDGNSLLYFLIRLLKIKIVHLRALHLEVQLLVMYLMYSLAY